MNFVQLEYFMTLARLGSFRKTAEAHYISQPAVSKQISLLEKEWGVTLFDRSYRSATLTASGKIMYEMLLKSEAEYRDALSEARLKSRDISCVLRLGLPESSHFANLSSILMEFQQKHPEILLRIAYTPLSALSLRYPDGDFDMVISYGYNLRSQPSLETRRLATRRHLAIVSENYAKAAGDNLSFEDLKHECLLVPASSGTSITQDYATYICEYHGFAPLKTELLPNIESVLMAVKIDFGYAILDDLVTLPEDLHLSTVPTNVSFPVLLA
ncbi:MAG: LysR family transcriptional regulator [Lachnospiraceae bacterium]|nr:LysR family transcriptional regulator [Lachnospiraceae bacterium]